jgi:glycosyltransferase involved in cell wall biosynthesis
LPCVVTRVGDAEAIVADTGRVVAPGNPQQLADALLDEIATLGSSQGERARERIIQNFSPRVMINRTAELLEEAD